MNITFVNPGVEYMLARILDFQTEEASSFWTEPLYYFYPQLDREFTKSLKPEERRDYITSVLRLVYHELEDTFDQKVIEYASYWDIYRKQTTSALSDAFGIDCNVTFNDLRCNVSMNPIEPRFLQEHYFDIFYRNSPRGAVGECIHEIIHFVWFYVWNRTFGDTYEEYESPSLKWILSEMVVESIMKDSRLADINPYFPRENGGCIYPYFFTMMVDGELILDTLDRMYRSLEITEFMKSAYFYCQKHEKEIREHIRKSEEFA